VDNHVRIAPICFISLGKKHFAQDLFMQNVNDYSMLRLPAETMYLQALMEFQK